jgi:hypothetical protein
MNYLFALAIALFLTTSVYAAEEKKVCVKEYDNKTKKEKEVCKTIKVHKKLEGTKIPEKK